jgi:hypothetical protein
MHQETQQLGQRQVARFRKMVTQRDTYIVMLCIRPEDPSCANCEKLSCAQGIHKAIELVRGLTTFRVRIDPIPSS